MFLLPEGRPDGAEDQPLEVLGRRVTISEQMLRVEAERPVVLTPRPPRHGAVAKVAFHRLRRVLVEALLQMVERPLEQQDQNRALAIRPRVGKRESFEMVRIARNTQAQLVEIIGEPFPYFRRGSGDILQIDVEAESPPPVARPSPRSNAPASIRRWRSFHGIGQFLELFLGRTSSSLAESSALACLKLEQTVYPSTVKSLFATWKEGISSSCGESIKQRFRTYGRALVLRNSKMRECLTGNIMAFIALKRSGFSDRNPSPKNWL